MINFWVWKLSKDSIVSYSPNAAAVLCFARVGCEDIRQEFGVRASNEVLCELANGRVINRGLLREIGNRLFEAGQGKAIQKGLVVDISRSDLAARKKEFAWGEYDIPESMGIPAPTKVPFSKFDLERDIVDRMLRLLGYGRFSLIDPNAGQKSESGADVLAKFDDHRIAFQVRQYHSDVDGNTAAALAELANEMEPQAAAQIAKQAAQRLAAALEKESEPERLSSLGAALAALANKMESQAAAQVAKQAARRLAAALEDPHKNADILGANPDRLSGLAAALAAVANKMEPQAVAQIAKGLAAALENPQETNSVRLSILGDALAAVANKMEPQTAAEIAKGLAAALENPQITDSYRLSGLGRSLAAVCRLLPSARDTHLLALSDMLLRPVSKEAAEGKEQPDDRKLLAEVCTQLYPEDLAEVLKYPFCTGEAEQIVLDQLKARTQRDFGGDVWKFVEQANSLGIKEVDSPAKRPSVQDALKELNAL